MLKLAEGFIDEHGDELDHRCGGKCAGHEFDGAQSADFQRFCEAELSVVIGTDLAGPCADIRNERCLFGKTVFCGNVADRGDVIKTRFVRSVENLNHDSCCVADPFDEDFRVSGFPYRACGDCPAVSDSVFLHFLLEIAQDAAENLNGFVADHGGTEHIGTEGNRHLQFFQLNEGTVGNVDFCDEHACGMRPDIDCRHQPFFRFPGHFRHCPFCAPEWSLRPRPHYRHRR